MIDSFSSSVEALTTLDLVLLLSPTTPSVSGAFLFFAPAAAVDPLGLPTFFPEGVGAALAILVLASVSPVESASSI